ncbi:unnamed protein product [Spirodela intermedia]|uniref:NADH:ubiquinone reductase (non-electrogenic) n=1 Tax=Spirodela intermedia TaxID=51605 RepID=A0A7I8IG00_SPIIN|nr:unnamed protein product [Spirodela intermedia]CAA6656639.1 unnamed protein product [Spirodela intermedia]
MPIILFISDTLFSYSHISPSTIVYTFPVNGGGVVVYADSRTDPSVTGEQNQAPPKKKVVVLGTGWAGTSFLKNLDSSMYDVHVVSPRNYFAFTPLLPSVTCGTVDARSIVEPVRNIIRKKGGGIKFWEAECFKIDPTNKKIYSKANTFNTPGVIEHCHFLKEVEDAQRIRRSVIDCFERASLPNLTDEERKKNLHFVIVGGGPTGVEFAAELHDFVNEDLVKIYPRVQELAKISVIEAGEHILTMFDKRITEFAEGKFQRDGINVKTGYKVVNVSDRSITMVGKGAGEVDVPYGMAVWSTGIGTRPVMLDLMKQIGQGGRRALATDEWLRVRECDGCMRSAIEDISAIFRVADADNSGTLTVKEIQDVLGDICERYPQVELYLKSKQMKSLDMELNIEQFKKALEHVDFQVKNLPATAQVAAQQGAYLARCFNLMQDVEGNPEGPLRIRESGRHRFRPFRYRHLGQFAPLGGEQTAAQLPGDWISIGYGSQWLWYSIYASKQVSWRTRVAVVSNWARRFIFGRDSSCI